MEVRVRKEINDVKESEKLDYLDVEKVSDMIT